MQGNNNLPPKMKKRRIIKSKPPKVVQQPQWNDRFGALKEQRIPNYNPLYDNNA